MPGERISDSKIQWNLQSCFLQLQVESLRLAVYSQQIVWRLRKINIYLTRIEVDEQGIAARLFPFLHPNQKDDPKVIVIDPSISFGRPVIVGTGIPTRILADRHEAGESVEILAIDYDCDCTLIQKAIAYECKAV